MFRREAHWMLLWFAILTAVGFALAFIVPPIIRALRAN